MDMVNLTPHPVHLVTTAGVTHTIPPNGVVARVSVAQTNYSAMIVGTGSIPLVRIKSSGPVVGLPPQKPGITLIVSQQVAAACPDRVDVFFPTDPVRTQEGTITAARALGTHHPQYPNTN